MASKLKTKTHKPHSINTKIAAKQITPEIGAKDDKELLALGTREDGGMQVAHKTDRPIFKNKGLDIGKYMQRGYAVTTSTSDLAKKLGDKNA